MARQGAQPVPPKKLERARPSAQPGSRGPIVNHGQGRPWAGKGKGKKGKKDKVAVIPGGLTAEEEKDRQLKAKKAFEYFKETKVEEKKFDTYRQEQRTAQLLLDRREEATGG